MLVVGGKFSALRIVWLETYKLSRKKRRHLRYVPYLLLRFHISFQPVPHRDNVLVLSHTDRTSTYLGPLACHAILSIPTLS